MYRQILENGKVKVLYSKKKKPETASVKPAETAMKAEAEPKHVGGGWYEVNGKKVRKSDLEAGD